MALHGKRRVCPLSAAAGEEPAGGGGEDDPGGAVLQHGEQRRCGADCGGAGLRSADEGRLWSTPLCPGTHPTNPEGVEVIGLIMNVPFIWT